MNQHNNTKQVDRRNFLMCTGRRIAAFALGLVGGSFIPGKDRNAKAVTPSPRPHGVPQQENPYEYNLDALKQIDPRLITYNEVKTIAAGQDEVTALALDNTGNVYIGGNGGIRITNSDGQNERWISLPVAPTCLTVDDNGDIYVGLKDRIDVLSAAGQKKTEFHSLGETAYITCIAVDRQNVFLADAGQRIIWRMSQKGAMLGQIAGKDLRAKIPGLIVPSPYLDIALDDNGNLWVVNPGRHAFELYTPEGKLLTSWNKTSMQVEGFSGCCNPTHIALMPDGSFVTSEKGLERIKIHEKDGKLRTVVAAPSQFKEGTVGLDLAVNKQGQIFVLDPVRKQVRVFEKK